MNNQTVRLLDHTADMGIEARASSCLEAMEAIARGLAEVMFGDSMAAAVECATLEVSADDPVELMVAFLNEIVYWSEKNNLVPAECVVTDLTEKRLRAKLCGEGFDPLRHHAERQVKSVTYHQACLEQNAGTWLARVYVDL